MSSIHLHCKDFVHFSNILAFKQALAEAPLIECFAGIRYKLLFNLPYLTALYTTTQTDNQTAIYASWLLTGLLYPLHTIKVRAQLLTS